VWAGALSSAAPAWAQSGGKGGDGEDGTTEFGDSSSFGEQVEVEPPKRGGDGQEGDLAPDAKHGILAGVVRNEAGEPVPDAQVVVLGRKERAMADHAGRYRLRLPPGVYAVRVYYPGFRTRRVEMLRIGAGASTQLGVRLERDGAARKEEVFVVQADADRTSAAGQLVLRRRSAAVSDALGGQDMARAPDRSAAEAARRVVGATLVDNRFVFVRGLGDRYTNSLLNNTPLPSPEPDVQAIPLDLFPTSVLSDITIFKTFTPDMPANFAGGSVRINTRSFPDKFLFRVTGTGGYNTQSTLRLRDSYAGGSTDWLATDDGGRSLPRELARSPRAVNQNYTPEQLERLGEGLNQKPRRFHSTRSLPNHALTVVAGDRYRAGNKGVWGWLASANYSRAYELRDEVQALFSSDVRDGQRFLIPTFDFRGRRSTETVRLGGLGSLAYEPSPDHRLALTTLFSRNADDEVLRLQGYEQDDGTDQRVLRARWLQRSLLFGQLRGEHELAATGASHVDWNVFVGEARRDEPNLAQSVYARAGDGRWAALQDDGLTHFFAKQKELLHGGGLDLTQRLATLSSGEAKLKMGTLLQRKARRFDSRRFRFVQQRGLGEAIFLPPEQLTDPQNIGPNGVLLDENTQFSDSYRAHEGIYAGYLMADTPLTRRVRVILGERLEYGRMTVDSYDPLLGGAPVSAGFQKADLLPSASVVLAMTDAMNLRASATQTVARPQFREIAPFEFASFFNAPMVKGNPDLGRARITNLDLRWEWFPSADEVLAASLFYKHFASPIEQTILPSSNITLTFENARAARNLGGELEARKRLGFVHGALRDVSVLANVAVVHSRVELADTSRLVVTTADRPLQGQSPFALNAALDFTPEKWGFFARLSYNVMGKRIAAVAKMPLPNIYEQPRHVLDASVGKELGQHLTLKASAQNLLNSPYLFRQQDRDTTRYTVGTSFLVSVSGGI
jgi:hypothetical protein